MKICTFEASGRERLGVLDGAQIIEIRAQGESFLNQVMRESPTRIGEILKGAPRFPYAYDSLRLPIRPVEVWGAGVTYLRSREARETETKTKGVYDFLYNAVRPEVFLKGSGQRAVGPGEAISVRSDSNWTVPEPELAVVLNKGCEVLGYTIANDVSARDIEGQNPLYLPQSKIYRNSCAIGPVVTTRDEIPDPHKLRISMTTVRKGKTAFAGEVSTSKMKRSVDELIGYLKRNNVFFGWIVFMTGTGIVPPDDFSLRRGDVVEIEIEKIGTLRNPVTKLAK